MTDGAGSLRIVVAVEAENLGNGGPAERLAHRLAGRSGVTAVERRVLRRARRRGGDPFGLRERVPTWACDAVLVVAGPRWGARRLLPGPSVAGRAVSLVQVGGDGEIAVPRPVPSAGAPWVVAAMAKDDFLRPTADWARTLTAGGHPAVDLRADRARREDLVAALQAGPGIVLYAGHGRTRGWSGYQGIRWRHLASAMPSGGGAELVIAFACDTLKRSRGRVPFGSRVVAAGVAGAYLGAAASVRTRDAEALAEVVVPLLARGTHATPAHLVSAVDRALEREGPEARRAWAAFRLVGDPTGPLGGGRRDSADAAA